jgi:DNA polymerase-3 subunit epsilon
MLELQRPLVVFDVETTGLDLEQDRVIEIAALKIHPDGTREERCRRLNPEMPIPAAATEIHGITDADVTSEPTFAQAARAIFEYFDGCDLSGYNVRRFDVPILAAEFRRVSVRWPAEGAVVVDAFKVYRLQEELHTLAKAHEHYGLGRLDVAHAALADVSAAARVLEAQAQRYGAADIAALERLSREPDWADSEGKLLCRDGQIVIGFGHKHKGEPLSQVPGGYLRWMLKDEFQADTKAIVRAELERREANGQRTTPPTQEELSTLFRESYDPQSERGL